MNRLVRVAATGAAALVLGASALAVPTTASAADPLPAPELFLAMAADGGEGPSDGIVSASFGAPGPTLDPSKVLTGFQAVLRTGDAFATVVQNFSIDNPKARTTFFEGLNYGQEYMVGVRAVYSVEGGVDYSAYDYNDPESGMFGEKLVPLHDPLPVTNLKASSKRSGSITATWNIPTTPAHTTPALGYSISAMPFDSGNQMNYSVTSCGSTCRTATLTGLRNGVEYDVTVGAISMTGYSFDDPWTTVTPYGAPVKPRNLTASRSGSTVKLDWNPSKSTAAGPVKGYKVYVNGSLKKTVGKSVSLTSVTGIKKGKTYTFAVRAYNDHGFSSLLTLKKKW